MSDADRCTIVVFAMSCENALRFELQALALDDLECAASMADAAARFAVEAFALAGGRA